MGWGRENKMNNLLRLALLIVCTVTAQQVQASTNAAGKTVVARGDVKASSAGESRKLRRRSPIFDIDTVTTGAKSRAQLRMSDGGMVALQENTQLEISEYTYDPVANKGSAVMNLISGGIRTVTGKLKSENGDYKLETPVGSIGIRGTHYEVELVNGELFVAVWDGAIDIDLSVGGNDVSLSLGDGAEFNYVKVSPDGEITPFTEIPDNFQDGHSTQANEQEEESSDESSEEEQTAENDESESGSSDEGSDEEQTAENQEEESSSNDEASDEEQTADTNDDSDDSQQTADTGDDSDDSQQTADTNDDSDDSQQTAQTNDETSSENGGTDSTGDNEQNNTTGEDLAANGDLSDQNNAADGQNNSDGSAEEQDNDLIGSENPTETEVAGPIPDEQETPEIDNPQDVDNGDSLANTSGDSNEVINITVDEEGANSISLGGFDLEIETSEDSTGNEVTVDVDQEIEPEADINDEIANDFGGAEEDIIADRTGIADFSDVISHSLVSTSGTVSNVQMLMEVNFDQRTVDKGTLSFNDPDGEWFAAFNGVINQNALELGVNFASHGNERATGEITGGFVNSGENIVGEVQLQEVDNPNNNAGGSYTLGERK